MSKGQPQRAEWRRSRKPLVLIAAAVLVAFVQSPVSADDCAPIYRAFEALSAAPSVSQTVSMAGMPPMQSVIIGDTVYAHDGTKWIKIVLKAGGRMGMLKQFVPDAGSLKDCVAAGVDTLDGKAMTTYTYVPPTPAGMEAFAPKDPGQKLWVGDEDGLPHRMTAEGTEVTISYDHVEPPVP